MYRQLDNGLTVREERFAQCLALGMDATTSYRKCFANRGRKDNAIQAAASRLAKRPSVRVRAETWLREAKCSDLQTAGDWMQDLLDGIAKAKAASNWTAFAALKRLSGQALGTIRDTVLIREEQSMSDETLVRQLAKADPAAAATLQRLLGKPVELKRAA